MIEIPPRIAIPRSILQGSIFHYEVKATNHDGSPYTGERFFVVLNANPAMDEELIMITITSKIAERWAFIARAGQDPSTLVPISTKDFSALGKPSVGNCNKTYPITMGNLIKKVEAGGKMFFNPLSKNIINSLVAGVVKSTLVSNEHKKKLI